jgi:hypothetical protein
MIGLILGDSKFGTQIINKLTIKKKKFIIIDISKNKIHKNINSFSLSIGQLGKAISILKKNKCKEIIFAGRVSMPNFQNMKFDFKALYHLPRIIKSSKSGDFQLIKEIIKIFNKEEKHIQKQKQKKRINKIYKKVLNLLIQQKIQKLVKQL